MISDIIFCKQETAYEMRISDWSSDVCSSDLLGVVVRVLKERHVIVGDMDAPDTVTGEVSAQNLRRLDAVEHDLHGDAASFGDIPAVVVGLGRLRPARSEEHTSELQSLKRISYAVFCLKKKKNKQPHKKCTT